MWVMLLLLIVIAGLLIGHAVSPAGQARRKAEKSLTRVESVVKGLQAAKAKAEENVGLAARNYMVELQVLRLRSIPVDDLKRQASGLRLQALKDAGLHTLADLQGWSATRLAQLRGIGPDSSARIAHAASSLIAETNRLAVSWPTPGDSSDRSRTLLSAICVKRQVGTFALDPSGDLTFLVESYRALRTSVRSKTTFLRWVRGFGSHSGVLEGIQESDAMVQGLQGGSPHARTFGAFSQRLAEATLVLRKGSAWTSTMEDMTSHLNEYESHFLNHLGPKSTSTEFKAKAIDQARASNNPKETQRMTRPSVGTQVAYTGQPYSPSSFDPYQSTTRPTSADASKFWIPPGQDVTVEGFKIPGGMVYLGAGLASIHGGGIEPALINPQRAVSRNQVDCHIRQMDYWPSYDTITADARGSYLQWLASGKNDPKADLGYVFLYFYGLERRVLSDTSRDPGAKAELLVLEQEIRRLLSIYGQSGSFRSYATSLLEFILAGRNAGYEQGAPPSPSGGRGLGFELRMGLGFMAREQKPLRGDWALAWYLSDPSTRIRTAMTRCSEIFASIFRQTFEAKFPSGMSLPSIKTRLKVSHRPASSSFGGQVYTASLDLPDVSVLSAPVQNLQEIGETSHTQLASYARFVGRNPGEEHSLDALLLLPIGFWPEALRSHLQDLQDEVFAQGEPRIMRVVDLLVRLPEGTETTKSKYSAICSALGALDLGIEPDVRFGGVVPDLSGAIALFRVDGMGIEPSLGAAFPGAALLLQLASAVAAADGIIGLEEEQLLRSQIQLSPSLLTHEKQRLQARLTLFKSAPPNLNGLKKRIDTLEMSSKAVIGDVLVRVVQADGEIAAPEIKSLEKIFKLLSLDTASLYSKLHGAAAAAAEPVTVRPGDKISVTFGIPKPPLEAPSPGGMKLDMAKVEALKADSIKVSALLGAIFTEQDEPPVEDSALVTQSIEGTSGLGLNLDSEHFGLLQVLLRRAQWTRSELEELCADRGLMVDGAIEHINEAAFERFDRPLLEGEDPVDVNQDLMLEEVA